MLSFNCVFFFFVKSKSVENQNEFNRMKFIAEINKSSVVFLISIFFIFSEKFFLTVYMHLM